MPFGQKQKQTEGERVRAWKEKNPDKVANQRHRRKLRDKAAERAADPTGELNYGPIEGVDAPYPDASENPKQEAPPPGIEEPPDFLEELDREHKRRILERFRKELEGGGPPQRS